MGESAVGEIMAVLEVEEGRVDVRFPCSIVSLRLTPKTARHLAELLTHMADEAEEGHDPEHPPGPGDQPPGL